METAGQPSLARLYGTANSGCAQLRDGSGYALAITTLGTTTDVTPDISIEIITVTLLLSIHKENMTALTALARLVH